MNNPNDYKYEVIQAAIDGLIQGGFSKEYAEMFRIILMRVYESGYREGLYDQR